MKQTTIETIAPIAERILSLRAAADFQYAAAEICEDGSIQGAHAAQSKINVAIAYQSEATALHTQARNLCRANGDSLPGLAGLAAIADSVYA